MINKFKPQPEVREADSKCRLSLNIVYRRIDELKPDPANPRRHTKQQIRKIADTGTRRSRNRQLLLGQLFADFSVSPMGCSALVLAEFPLILARSSS